MNFYNLKMISLIMQAADLKRSELPSLSLNVNVFPDAL
jgi:hypothetical protein